MLIVVACASAAGSAVIIILGFKAWRAFGRMRAREIEVAVRKAVAEQTFFDATSASAVTLHGVKVDEKLVDDSKESLGENVEKI